MDEQLKKELQEFEGEFEQEEFQINNLISCFSFLK
jgi:hypothetical protein